MEDVALVNASVDAYAAEGVECSHDKAYRYKTLYEALGTEVDGDRGCAAAPLDNKRRQVCRLVGRFLSLSRVAKTELQSVMGGFVYPFMHARTLMSSFDQSYTRIALMSEHGFKMWDPVVKDEMLASVLFLPNAEASLRACVSSLISATDATITHTGGVPGCSPEKVAQFLYRRPEKTRRTR